MEQTMEIVKQFMFDTDRLVFQEIVKNDRIKKTRIRHLENGRAKLEKIEEPFRGMSLRMLDEVSLFVAAFNDRNSDDAERHYEKVRQAMEEIGNTAERMSDYGL